VKLLAEFCLEKSHAFGIIGLPQSGKTTVFNALAREPAGDDQRRALEVHTAVVDVPDRAWNALRAVQARETIHAKVTYADIAGLEGSAAGKASAAIPVRCSTS
jgi:ribosome-binding ATPase YchF (GTP1/OBG family)